MEPPKIGRRRPINTWTQKSFTGFASGHLSHYACPNIVTGKETQNLDRDRQSAGPGQNIWRDSNFNCPVGPGLGQESAGRSGPRQIFTRLSKRVCAAKHMSREKIRLEEYSLPMPIPAYTLVLYKLWESDPGLFSSKHMLWRIRKWAVNHFSSCLIYKM